MKRCDWCAGPLPWWRRLWCSRCAYALSMNHPSPPVHKGSRAYVQHRPLRERVWFWRPSLHWFGWRTLSPVSTGGDEYDWHTIVLGWTITGRIIIATRRCPKRGRCAGAGPLAPDWPVGWNEDAWEAQDV